MAKAVVNPPAELTPRTGDVNLTLEQLGTLGVFASLKKAPTFAKFPGTYVLRHYRPGEIVCRQGERGGTAFYLLTRADVEALAAQLATDSPDVSGGDREPSRREFQRVSRQLQSSSAAAGEQDAAKPLRLATARLLFDKSSKPTVRRSAWPWSRKQKSDSESTALLTPRLIANDGPSDIDYDTKQAAMYEGEVFGEMSCLWRQPRSATIVVDQECFALEFLRNILDQMRKDPGCKQATEQKYQQRVLESHLRQFSIFTLLSEAEFHDVREHVELIEFSPGTVIWDQGDLSDSLLIVRSGVVQVLQNFPWRLTQQAITNWEKLWATLRGTSAPGSALERLRKALLQQATQDPSCQRLRKSLDESADEQKAAATTGEPDSELNEQLVFALNQLAKTDVLLAAKETLAERSTAEFIRETSDYPAKVKDWSGMQIRRANRVLYRVLLPDAIPSAEPIGIAKVLRYLGRGDTLGEIGLVTKQPRSASCIAYSHPELDRETTAVELVRIPATAVWEMEQKSPRIKTAMAELAAKRQSSGQQLSTVSISALSQSRRAEELGLLQGQNLMLIDLDRCTRCGDCVQACIATHDDGYSRLFLDGPRFGKYLVPSSCRLCRDPVCMIGCPVGSIQQGDDGEIRIREWCIGCGVCARQCPYDSIQMHDTAIIPPEMQTWHWMNDLEAAHGERWHESSFRDSKWHTGGTPFRWNIDMQQAILAARRGTADTTLAGRLYFRTRFQIDAAHHAVQGKYRLVLTSQGTELSAYLNGRRLDLTQDAPQKKRFEQAATVTQEELRRGENVLAFCLAPPSDFNAMALDVRFDALTLETAEIEEKLVTERAVVCDQCSSLSGNRHACVYACPHEAALRIDTWIDFPEG